MVRARAIAKQLNAGTYAWCELYTARFDYDKTVNSRPQDQAKLEGSVPKAKLPTLKSAKTRYIIFNQARRKNGQLLMTNLADSLANLTQGIVAEHQKPSR